MDNDIKMDMPNRHQKTHNAVKKYWPILVAVAMLFLVMLVSGISRDPCENGHRWLPADCYNPQTCRNCGLTQGSSLNHRWLDATCTAPRTCDFCGQTQGNAADHRWIEATCLEPRTCAECGQTQGNVAGHSWLDATCTAPKTCVNCGQTEGSAKSHQWEPATLVTPMTCKNCGATQGTATFSDDFNIDDYVMSVREKFSNIYGKMTDGYLVVEKRNSGTKLYYDRSNVLQGITVYHGIDGIGKDSSTYSRTYVFDQGELIMAVYDGGNSLNHRFYFYDEQLLQWKHTHTSGVEEYHTLESTDEYKYWESVILGEVNDLLGR